MHLAAKYALLELPPSATVPLTPSEHADRMATAVKASAQRDRALVSGLMGDVAARLQPLDGGTQLRALQRLGDQGYFWDLVEPALAGRMNEQIGRLPLAPNPWDPLPPETSAYLVMVRDARAREHLPILEQRFAALDLLHRLNIIGAHPDPYFIPALVKSLGRPVSFRTGEQVGQIVVLHAPFLSQEELKVLLFEWANNDQCRAAAQMLGLAVSLFHGTAHLDIDRVQAFQEFLSDVNEQVAEGEIYYTYPDLQAARPRWTG